jgi:outer membrane protein TolC
LRESAEKLSENFRVLDRQRGLSQAQGVELQSLIAYRQSIITLQKAMYTLLEANDFEIAKTSSENVPNLK